MKTIYIIIAFIIITLSAQSQTVDTTESNPNRLNNTFVVKFMFNNQQQRLFQAVLGEGWKKDFIDGAMRLTTFVRQSDDVERALSKAKRDSIAYHRDQIERLKDEVRK